MNSSKPSLSSFLADIVWLIEILSRPSISFHFSTVVTDIVSSGAHSRREARREAYFPTFRPRSRPKPTLSEVCRPRQNMLPSGRHPCSDRSVPQCTPWPRADPRGYTQCSVHPEGVTATDYHISPSL
ncbi:unnamed protein product [Protopolystoma xenopodis]|uniref:Uncharacterized protein n=1 Tax=Protopolystoma xenopodis TaxID=117903 RepID=A0A448WRS6_9PLAT|nr:unnamed protein product [Protopolystoma xenopodis]